MIEDLTMREWLCAFEAVRRLGFDPDDIHFVVCPSGISVIGGVKHDHGEPVVGLMLRTQGIEWMWVIGSMPGTPEEIQDVHIKACALWNSGEHQDVFERYWAESNAVKNKVKLITSLLTKGIKLPVSASS